MTDNKHIRLPKLGDIRIDGHRSITEDYVIKSATISKKASGRYFISILTEYELEVPEVTLDTDKSIGLDYSSHDFYVDNQNRSPEGFKHLYRISEPKLVKEQRKLSHMCHGSHNYQKQKAKVAKVHEHIANQRTDFIEKLSCSLSDTYDIVCLEDINLQNISQCLTLGKSTMDNGFGFFRTRLEQKMGAQGRVVVKINQWFPSSKMCHHCGTINSELKLSNREWDCACGQHILRDQNAAENIRTEGLRLLSL